MRVAIVGAGPSGLAALRALDRAGFDATAYERGARIGGVWTLEDRPTASYRSLHLITSRARTEFAEHPMPAGTPDYPSAESVGRYLESYVERFGLTERVRLSAGVERAERREGGGWELELADGTGETADVLVVANGHNDVPKWPDPPYPGDFDGSQEHALDYDDSSGYAGKRALVVGMGNSAMDIATDISYVADRTLLSVRHGSWVIPKRLLGRPADQVVKPWVAVNVPWRHPPAAVGVSAPGGGGAAGPLRPAGAAARALPGPPTISDTILSRISHGRIEPKPGIEELSGDGVRFTDGAVEPVDAIVWCTGYRVAMPFLPTSWWARTRASSRLQARAAPRRGRPLLRRPHAVHRLGVPDRRAPVAAPGRAPGRALGPAPEGRDARRLRAAAARGAAPLGRHWPPVDASRLRRLHARARARAGAGGRRRAA